MIKTIIYKNKPLSKEDERFLRLNGFKIIYEAEDIEGLKNEKYLDDTDLIIVKNLNITNYKEVKSFLVNLRIPFIFWDSYFKGREDDKNALYILKQSFKNRRSDKNIITIASSTGGPNALQEIIPRLPSNLNAAIIIVQHMPANFTDKFAERLNFTSSIHVKEAEDGEFLMNGTVYIAPGDYHITIRERYKGYSVNLKQGEKHLGLRPAADILMESVAENVKWNKLGLVLTGMGSDGAIGFKALKKVNSYNMVQDEESSLIYGMPKAAVKTECVDEVVKLEDIADKILLKVGCEDEFRY